MNWRPQLDRVREDFKTVVAPEHSRQAARKLMRNIAKMEATKAKREARRTKLAERHIRGWNPPEADMR